jgi:two-component sensor histidine kinase
LSNLTGHVELTWREEDERIHVDWTEHGGPSVTKPEREGFGTKVVSRAFTPEFEAKVAFDYRPEGLCFSLIFKSVTAPAA